MNIQDFKPGDRVEFCGEEAIVIANHGSMGTVEIPGQGRMRWYWEFQGEPVKHVQTSGGVCRKCSGWTTYTRQNSDSGLCLKCETEG